MAELYSMITTQQRAMGVVLYEPINYNKSIVSVVSVGSL